MDELLRLLTEFGADEATVDLATRYANRETDGATPLTDEEIDTLLAAIVALADEDEASPALLNEAVAAATALRTEQADRAAAAEAEEAEVAAARAELRGETAEDETPAEGDEPAEGNEPAEAPAEGEEGDEPPAEGDDGGEVAPSEEEAREAVTASGSPAAARRRPRTQRRHAPAASNATGPRIAMLDRVPGVGSIGDDVDIRTVNRALLNRAQSFRGRGSKDGGQEFQHIARIEVAYPPERRLDDGDGYTNGDRVTQALQPAQTQEALTAAGGICAMPTPIYTQVTFGDARRPVRDALVGFQATRGGVISIAPPTLPSLTGAVDLWTHENDADPEDPATKPCLDITCGDPATTQIDAVTLCLGHGNFGARTFSENENAWSQLGMVAHARFAEQNLIAEMQTLSTAVTTEVTKVSGTIDLLEALGRAAWGMRSRHRMPANYPFRVILPEIVQGILVEDLARRMPGGTNLENLAVSGAMLDRLFAARALNVTYSPDMRVSGAQGAGALVAWPTAADVIIYPEGTFLFLDGGTLDLGVVRDSTLNGVNSFQTFVETFEGVHKVGGQSLKFAVNLCIRGAVVGTLDPDDFCASLT